MVNYGLAFRKPFTNLKTLIIGIIITLIPIVNLISLGFIFRSSGVGKVKSKENMPEWGDWFNLFITGLLGVIATIIYMIPALIVFSAGAGIAAGSLMGTFAMNPQVMGQFTTGAASEATVAAFVQSNWPVFAQALLRAAPLILLGFLLVLLGIYFIPMAIMSYIKSGKFGDAFALGTIARKCFTGEYFVVWLVAMIVFAIVKWILAFIPLIGIAIGIFIGGIIAYSLFGQVYGEIKK